MTENVKHRVAKFLMECDNIIGDKRHLPMAYIVGEHIYIFLNAARREAFCSELPIERMTIEEAAYIHTGVQLPYETERSVSYDFDQHGELFGACLFCDNPNIKWNSKEVRKFEK